MLPLLFLPFPLSFHNVCPVLQVCEEQTVPYRFKCVGREDRNYSAVKKFYSRRGGGGKVYGRGRKPRHKVINKKDI